MRADNLISFLSILHEGMSPLVGALNSFADHSDCPSWAWPETSSPPFDTPSAGCSGWILGGPACGAYLLRNSAKALPRGRRPGTMLQVSALASMIVTFGSPEMVRRSFAAPPRTTPAVR